MHHLPASIPFPPPGGNLRIGSHGKDLDVRIPSEAISNPHAVLRCDEQGHPFLEDQRSRHGTHVNGVELLPGHRRLLCEGDLLVFGQAVFYRVAGQALQYDRPAMSLRLRDLTIRRNRQTIVAGLNVQIRPGQFVGILGSSGAGKSTLLKHLLGRQPADQLRGLAFDGMLLHDPELEPALNQLRRRAFHQAVGYVPQDDVVPGYLTVGECLALTAQLHTACERHEEREERVRHLIGSLIAPSERQQEQIAARRISHLSGGQRKRVSIAMELLRRPRLLLLDEPTSGLDQATEFKLMEQLRSLSRRGTTVICTTHTLASMHYFDRLLILGPPEAPPEARQEVPHGAPASQPPAGLVYDGPADQLLDHFKVRRLEAFYQRLADGSGPRPDTICVSTDADEDEQHTSSVEHATVRPPLALQARIVYRRCWLAFCREGRGRAPRVGDSAVPSRSHRLTGWGTALLGLGGGENARLALLMPVVLALLIVVSQHRQTESLHAMTFLCLAALWIGMTATVREFVDERSLFRRDRLAGLRPLAYLAGKLGWGASLASIQTLLLAATFLLLAPQLFPPVVQKQLLTTSAAAMLLPLVLTALGGVLIGATISILASTARAAMSYLPLILLPHFLFSRIAFGAHEAGWSNPAARYYPLGQWLRGGTDTSGWTWSESLIAHGSLIFTTRPAAAAADLMLPPPAHAAADPASELLWLVVLVVLYGAICATAFALRGRQLLRPDAL